jgi:predicted RNase H-like nuclease (RuvC/YqgF family)
LKKKLEESQKEIKGLQDEVARLRQEEEERSQPNAEMISMAQACNELEKLNHKKDEEIKRYREQFELLQEQASSVRVLPTYH